jgi:hypothetical protein
MQILGALIAVPRLDGTTVQVRFFILAFLGLLFFGDRLEATSTKHIWTGIQMPAEESFSILFRARAAR